MLSIVCPSVNIPPYLLFIAVWWCWISDCGFSLQALIEYLLYCEQNPRKALELAAEATKATKYVE